jgi:hypothetical protein
MNNKKIYNLKQIEVACVIGSPILAGILIYYNYKNFGDRQKGFSWIFIGILWTLALFGLAMLIPENIVDSTQMVIPAINGLILYPIINRLQGAKIKDHFDNNGEKGSNWLVAGLTIVFAAMIFVPIIILNRITPISEYTRQSFDSNGIYYNTRMPTDEVNKLGGILKRVHYFNSESPAEVVFISTDTIYEFKIITDKTNFNYNSYLTDIQQIFKHISRYDFQKPLIFKLTDPYLKDDKIIELVNYDSIPLILEMELFAKNQNFRLLYEMSIDKSERDKFQKLIIDMDKIFSPQKQFDFLMDYEDNTYFLKLFIPKQNWNSPQLLTEARFIKERLNNFGFKYPFKLMLIDNSTVNVDEFEIE